jgi:hypothetical protein
MNFALRLIRGQIDLFKVIQDFFEIAQVKENLAESCREIDSLLGSFVSMYEQITDYDEAYRIAVFGRLLTVKEKIDREIMENFEALFHQGEKFAEVLERLSEYGFVDGFKHRARFYECQAELAGMFKGDRHFVGDKLHRLEKKAVEEQRAGRTVEMGRMDD